MVGVINTVLMSVLERLKEFGILKTIGAMPWDIFTLVWIETLILCTTGGVLGIVLALLLSRVADIVIRQILPYAPSGGLVVINLNLIFITLSIILCIGLLRRPLSRMEGGKGQTAGSDKERCLKTPDNRISIDARNLTKVYSRGNEEVLSVNDVSLQINKGDFVSIIGPSGSGKTTLINLLGCLDNPTSGELYLGCRPIFDTSMRLSERELTGIRREVFGYIFQNFYLIPTLTVMENVILPLTFYRKDGSEKGADKLLKLLGIDHRKNHAIAKRFAALKSAHVFTPGRW